MELPNYSRQLMQQLWTLRNEGQFCDCTIQVGDSRHRAHKLVLAASSMLFRSLLDSSDTISIDTALVSSQEFGSLLDMVYTGKLPLGKHNVSRIVAAADSLQMFDVAVGFKKVLSSIVSQPTAVPNKQIQTQGQMKKQANQPQIVDSEGAAAPEKKALGSEKPDIKSEQTNEGCQSGSADADANADADADAGTGTDANAGADADADAGEPACKRARLSETSGPDEATPTERVEAESNTMATKESDGSASVFLECFSELTELLSTVSSVLELLSKAAESSLTEQDRQVVCRCLEEKDVGSAIEKLMSRVKERELSEAALLKLLRTVQQKNPSSFPKPLLSLLEDLQKQTREVDRGKTAISEPSDAEQQNSTNEEEQQEEAEEEENSKEETEEGEEDETSSSAPHACRWCKKAFSYKCRMLAHVKRCPKSQESKQQCPLCPKKFGNLRALQRHEASAHPSAIQAKKKVSCDLCRRTFAHPSGMIYHKRTEHFEEKPFACEECGAKFGANSSLKNHMRRHTGEKPYHCKHCEMSFSVAAALAYHTKKKHSEGKMYECQYCKALFAQSIELTRHVRTHTGDRPYVCRECGKGYSQASGLTIHLQTFHNLSEPHDCQKCSLSFSSLEEHRQHIQEFHPKEFHKCSSCHKVFTSAALLEKHRATHTGIKPFICDLCNKSYQQLSGLWYHNRTTHPEVFANHTRQLKTLVQCDICFKFFPSANSLNKHQAAEHQGMVVGTVPCQSCAAVFSGEEELQEHISSQHQASPPFGCPLCSLLCSSQLELQEHLISYHMEAPVREQEGAPTSETVILTESVESKGAETITTEDQSQPAKAHQVFVAVEGVKEGRASPEVVEVSVDDLLNGSVTFVCEEKANVPDS
ncbi:hypothetical protein LDENG_00122920 [Lucifuga dentata]|nr:hypothetical protein LDENG_00122920 [Lucifuga dentata]